MAAMMMNGTTPARRLQEEADVGVAAVIMCYRNLLRQEKNAARDKAEMFEEAVATIEKKKFEAQRQFVQDDAATQVQKMFEALLRVPAPEVASQPKISISGMEREADPADSMLKGTDVLRDLLGFSLTVAPSTVKGAGNGVILNGQASIGSVVALFPGTVYLPEHYKKPEHMREIAGNVYARARFDSAIIDAKNERPTPRNQLAVAHMINHPPSGEAPNVMPFSFDFPITEPFTSDEFRPLIPNSFVEQPSRLAMFGKRTLVHGLAFIASTDIKDGQELFLNYRYNPNNPLPDWYTPCPTNKMASQAGAKARNKKCLYVGGLDRQVTQEILYAAFVPFGPVKEVQIPSANQSHGGARGYGFVEFEEEEDAQAALDNMDDAELFGKTLRVTIAKPERARLGSNKPVWAEIEETQDVITPEDAPTDAPSS
ncbi:TPA: hypothetical protein N0F65_011620 [Lagenidium giganteum]|uniref:Uncharacterized protein n=1 Tax=Lagenidium giganteum TaxID=4803 RepID=A0AAV2ZAC0_9STRA|nr:TPA: hypothetical protein N0F65_011620 [Lagenidium giganteum]